MSPKYIVCGVEFGHPVSGRLYGLAAVPDRRVVLSKHRKKERAIAALKKWALDPQSRHYFRDMWVEDEAGNIIARPKKWGE